MFAPYCPRCQTQVLLGTRRVVRWEWPGQGAPVVVLRCFCGELVAWDQERADAVTTTVGDAA